MNKFRKSVGESSLSVSVGEVFIKDQVTAEEWMEAEGLNTIKGRFSHTAGCFLASAAKIVFEGAEIDRSDYVEFFRALSIQDLNMLTPKLNELFNRETSVKKK